MKPRLFLWLAAAILIAGLVASPVFAQAAGTQGAPAKAAQKAETKAAPAAPAAGAATIPAPKIQAQKPPKPGMVWVNTASKKYFKEGSQYYGKTKEGKFMTEEEAKKAGYTAAATGGAKPAAKPAAKKTP